MTKQKALERWAAEGRPLSCPSCGSPRIARILYGLPAFSKDLDRGSRWRVGFLIAQNVQSGGAA